MPRRPLHIVLSACALLGAGSVYAAAEPVAVREFDAQKLEEYRQRSEYQYGESISFSFMEWWQRIAEKIARWLMEHLNLDIPIPTGADGLLFGRIVLWTVALLAAAFIVYLLFRGNWAWLFSGRRFRKKEEEKDYTVYDEDIHGINFTDEIDQAVQSKNYRKATRLFYLKSLKLLSDAGNIRWQINKTNTDYRREISSKVLREEFDYLSLAYEYVWYGEFEPTEETFLETFDRFRTFNNHFKPETATP